MNRRLGLVTLLASLALGIAVPTRADLQQTITFQYPPLPGAGTAVLGRGAGTLLFGCGTADEFAVG